MVVGSPTKLNLIPSGVMPVVYINQGDAGYDKEFLVYNGDSPYNVPAGVSATIRGKKADDYGVTEAAALTEGSNLVTVTITEQMVAAAGENLYELVFVDTDGLRIATSNMVWAVKKDALGGAAISESDLDYASQVMDQLQSVQAFKNQLDTTADGLAAETAARIAADGTLQTNINAEVAARTAADNTLQSNINTEASTRSAQDGVLQAQIDQLVAPTGSAPSAAEVENARIGADGVTYDTLGNAIRTQLNKKVDKAGYKEVNELNSTFFTIGDNRYNVNDTEDGVQINQDTDGTHAQSGFSTSGYIYVGDLTTVKFLRLNAAGTAYISDSAYYMLFDANRQKITNRNVGATADVSSATWMRVSNSTQYKASFMVVDNAITVETYIPYEFTFNYLTNDIQNKVDKNGTAQVNEQNTTFFSIGTNKFDPSTATDGVQLNQASDGVHEQSGFTTTDYIDVSELDSITFYRRNAAGTAFVTEASYYMLYNANKLRMTSRLLAATVDVSEAAYIRISLSTSNKPTFMVVDSGVVPTDYIPFKYVFDYSDTIKDVVVYPNDHILAKLVANEGKNIYFAEGDYDIIAIYEDYYGADFFTNYTNYSSDMLCRGLPVYRNTKMTFSPNARFTCHYTGANANVRQNFSAFAFENEVTFDGLWIEASGIRNVIHDDFDGGYVGKTVIKNCHIKHDYIIIAGGFGLHELTEIYNNYFERTDTTTQVFDISYHNYASANAQSELIVKDNYFSKGVSIRYYGASTLISDCLISNNSMANDIEYRAENSSATIENVRVLAWNNLIRNT